MLIRVIQFPSLSYALIGPYHAASAATEFEPMRPSPFAEAVIEKLQDEHGLKVLFLF